MKIMSRLQDVNTHDIRGAIELGCGTMSRVFNADDNDVPFFAATAWPEAWMGFCDWATEAHVPGRHLNALLAAKEAIGFEPEASVIEKHARAALFSFGGSAAVPLNRRDDPQGPLVRFHSHNLREGLLALHALIRLGRPDPAVGLMKRCIETIQTYFDPERGLQVQPMAERFGRLIRMRR